ncbi:MAG: PPC domain-containing protein [Chloroflexi bacterium]|nr:PPC domain-containing protein [Chloroflexota bacterium]
MSSPPQRTVSIPRLRLFAAFLLLLCAGGVRAQTEQVFPLRPGTTIEGNINESIPAVRYSFEAQAGESVTILMQSTSGTLDPLLLLYGPDNSLVERNDDRESGVRDAEIARTLTRGGTHIIEATRFESTPSSGTFRLTLSVSGSGDGGEVTDPLASPPVFGVPFTPVAYQDVVSGSLTAAETTRYYAVGAQQGDLVRIIMTRTSGDLDPRLSVRNSRAEEISRESQIRAGESIAYVTFPETGWYLIEAGARSGSGGYDLYLNRLADAVLQVGEAVTNTFVPQTPTLSFIMNARIGDLVTLTMFATDAASGVRPELELLDLDLTVLDRSEGKRFATLRSRIPRSAPYIVRVSNLRPEESGGFSLRLTSVPADVSAFAPRPLAYNSQTEGEITEDSPLQYFQFSGKTDELVTIAMAPLNSSVDPFLILMDSDLNELAANNDAGVEKDARITQYRLPKDGNYLILASRAGLETGATTGGYRLSLTAGEIDLTLGALSATLTWQGTADLNLLVRDPVGRIITWSSPSSPSGGRLQIDSNTDCQTPSDEPIEHIYWERTAPGDYAVWVWHLNDCGRSVAVPYSLTIRSGEAVIATDTGTLRSGERFDVAVRVVEDGRAFVLDNGTITQPTAQQRASESGDQPLRFSEPQTGELDDQVYTRFYRFTGTAGDRIVLSVEQISGDLDPIVVLRDANNNNLVGGTNDDADSSTKDAHLDYVLPYSGEYVVAVTRFGVREGRTSGTFRLTLSRSAN